MTNLTDIAPGAILYTSWGYEQTNIDFYQVIERRGKSTLILRQLQTLSEEIGWCSAMVTPRKDQFLDSPPLTRRISKTGTAKVADYAWLHPWDGKPKNATSYA